MAILARREELGIKITGVNVTVPNSPKARLMYYLSCVSTVLDLSDNEHISHLTNYTSHYDLDDDDLNMLLTLVILFSPDELIGKVGLSSIFYLHSKNGLGLC